jgi:WD40 repeat protein/formylglycine-generating enzyme required for sulfatase activity
VALLCLVFVGLLWWKYGRPPAQNGLEVREIRSIGGGSDPVKSVEFSGDSKLLACGHDKTVKLWDLETGVEPETLSGHTDRVISVAISGDSRWLVSAGWDKTILLWDLSDAEKNAKPLAFKGSYSSVAITGDGTWVAFASGNTVRLWITHGAAAPEKISTANTDVLQVAISGDGRLLALANKDNASVPIWDPDSKRQIAATLHADSVLCVAASDNGAWIASGSRDRKIGLWCDRGKIPPMLEAHTDWVNCLAFSGHGKWLVSGGQDATIKIWDVAKGQELASIAGGVGPVRSIAISPDGQWLAAAGDSAAKLWRITLPGSAKTINPSPLPKELAPEQPLAETPIDEEAKKTPRAKDDKILDDDKDTPLRDKKFSPLPNDKVPDDYKDAPIRDKKSPRPKDAIVLGDDKDAPIRDKKLPPTKEDKALNNNETALVWEMAFVHIERGSFWMGWDSRDKMSTRVVIRADFELAKYSVTQGQWETVMGSGSNPSHYSRNGAGADKVRDVPDADLTRFPVENVSWDDIRVFLKRLNERERGRGWRYCLPTERQWEFACRGAATTDEECSFDFYFAEPTNDLASKDANFNRGGLSGNLDRPTKVGSYAPNKLGLYDMHGNVWQWCDDYYDDKSSKRVIRGGAFFNEGALCRAAARGSGALSLRSAGIGFRLARVPSGDK